MWVRFRSASPAGATRSSTCTTCTSFHGTSSSARARSICQGVWPPLTAIMKRPRTVTAVRASAAMIPAAFRATASASGSISMFMTAPDERQMQDQPLTTHRRVFPAPRRRYFLIDFIWSPGAGLVFVHRSACCQHGIDDAPRFFHVVFARKQGSVSCHGVPEYPFVGIHLFCTGMVARQQLHWLADHLLLRVHHCQTKGGRDFRTDAKAEIVLRWSTGGKDDRGPAQTDNDLSAGHRQRFSRPDVKRDALPAPGIDIQLQRDESLDFGIGGHALLLPIPAKLTADDVLRLQRRNRFQDLNLFVPDCFTIGSHRRLHGKIHQDLEQMILNHVADSTGLIVERSPALNSKVFRHGYLHTLALVASSERFQKRVLEAEEDHVMRRPFPQIMIDSEDVLLVESAEQNPVEFLRRDTIMTERFFNHDASAVRASSFVQLFHDRAE